jgi:hypothetical protein
MMSDLHKEAIAVLAEIWELSPDVRLGQLLAHLGFLGECHLGRSLGYIDDDELISVMHKHRSELLARLLESSKLLVHPTGPAASPSTPSEAAPATE